MTVTSKQHLVSYEFDSAQPTRRIFPIPFYFRSDSEIRVYALLYDAVPPYLPLIRTAAPATIDFGAGLHSGGQITLDNVQTTAAGEFLVIERVIQVKQLYDLANAGNLYPETIEGALDTITMIVQQMEYALSTTDPAQSRVMQLMPGSESGSSFFDAQGNTIFNVAEPTVDSEAATKLYVDGEVGTLSSTVFAILLQGSGSPQGVVAAPVGTLWLRQDGGTSTTLYVKETGAGTSSGWVAK